MNSPDLATVTGRDVAALQDPRPVNLIGAARASGEACFATVIWVTPVSHTPAMVAFALRAKSHTLQIIQETGAFSCTTLPATREAVQLTEFCGGNTGRLVDKGQHVQHTLVNVAKPRAESDPSATESTAHVPVPNLALSWVACTVDSLQEAGDHVLVVGTVQEARVSRNTPRDEHGQLTPTDTLLCVQHGCYAKSEVL